MALFVVFNMWIGLGFILSLVVNIYIFNSHFLVTALELDLFSGPYLNSLLFLSCLLIENNLI